jgi:CDP-paratose 2-epimerase
MSFFPPLDPRSSGVHFGVDQLVLITGGAGFVGCNLADHLLSRGHRVRIFDNLSRPGGEKNLAHLRSRHGERLHFYLGDIRDPGEVARALRGAGPVYHLAAQVAVTTSLSDPITDFEVNARGTLNLLEALRRSPTRHGLVFTSTNKVYGHPEDVPLEISGERYRPVSASLRHGFDEDRPLMFYGPYGCSKGAADQYVLDYARTYGVPAVVLRMSCIYGPHQCGNEDQSWIAHFLRNAISAHPITLYGDGRQVRDALHVDDLIDALLLAQGRIATLSGRAFNIGGGPARTTCLLELIERIQLLQGVAPSLRVAGWRAADQRYYVADIRRFCAATGWSPTIRFGDGLRSLHRWFSGHTAGAEEITASAGT